MVLLPFDLLLFRGESGPLMEVEGGLIEGWERVGVRGDEDGWTRRADPLSGEVVAGCVGAGGGRGRGRGRGGGRVVG